MSHSTISRSSCVDIGAALHYWQSILVAIMPHILRPPMKMCKATNCGEDEHFKWAQKMVGERWESQRGHKPYFVHQNFVIVRRTQVFFVPSTKASDECKWSHIQQHEQQQKYLRTNGKKKENEKWVQIEIDEPKHQYRGERATDVPHSMRMTTQNNWATDTKRKKADKSTTAHNIKYTHTRGDAHVRRTLL